MDEQEEMVTIVDLGCKQCMVKHSVKNPDDDPFEHQSTVVECPHCEEETVNEILNALRMSASEYSDNAAEQGDTGSTAPTS